MGELAGVCDMGCGVVVEEENREVWTGGRRGFDEVVEDEEVVYAAGESIAATCIESAIAHSK